MEKPRLIAVTHRLPWVASLNQSDQPKNEGVTLTQSAKNGIAKRFSEAAMSNSPQQNWTFTPRRRRTATYAGLQSLDQQYEVLYLGLSDRLFDHDQNVLNGKLLDSSLKASLSSQFIAEKNCYPVFIDEKQNHGHYEGYCKKVLWPLFHYILWDSATDGSQESNWREDYISVCQSFADAIVAVYKPGDTIWIQDYHLIMVPKMVREKLPNASIGFFLHTPFPTSELFRCLPNRAHILEGFLGANLIGFQTYSYSRHFVSSCLRLLGVEYTSTGINHNGNSIDVAIFPIGIDVEAQLKRINSPACLDRSIKLKELWSDMKIIVGRDKLDNFVGVQHKLKAFEIFLFKYPEWIGKVMLIQVTDPPQTENPKIESKIGGMVSKINGHFGSLQYSPITYYTQHLDKEEYCSLLCVADVGFITSVRDSMNTTSHEFVICQKDNHGPLILSEFTGTAGCFSSALIVNPWDYDGVANSINDALTMSAADKEYKHMQLFKHVQKYTAKFWATSFYSQLEKTYKRTGEVTPTPKLNQDNVLETYKAANNRLLLFDYDGTLTPIRKTPGAAIPPLDMLHALEALVSDPKNCIFIISGRDRDFLIQHLGHINGLGLSAEHGCFIKYPFSTEWENLMEESDLGWKEEVEKVFQDYTEQTHGSFIETKHSSLTWHYRLADPEYGIFQAQECQKMLESTVLKHYPLEILVGKKNLEVRPMAINKGEIVKGLLSKRPDSQFVFCAGDDKTDEDMFKVLPTNKNGVFSCKIGPSTKFTGALCCVDTPQDLIDVMCLISDQQNEMTRAE